MLVFLNYRLLCNYYLIFHTNFNNYEKQRTLLFKEFLLFKNLEDCISRKNIHHVNLFLFTCGVKCWGESDEWSDGTPGVYIIHNNYNIWFYSAINTKK